MSGAGPTVRKGAPPALRKMFAAWVLLIFLLLFLYLAGKAIVHLGRVTSDTSEVVTRSYFGRVVLGFEKEPFNIGEYTSATMLLLGGLVSLGTFHLLGHGPREGKTPSRRFWLVLACGLIYVSFDELFMFHEFADVNIPHLTDGRVLNIYVLAAAIFLVCNFRRMLPNRTALILLCCGFICHAAALALDIAQDKKWLSGWTPEELLEVLANTIYATYIFYVATRELVAVHGLRLLWGRPKR